jgi:short-subunit dehydrogenase
MRSFAIDVKETGVHVMLIHPGWVKTAMGGSDALVDVQTSVAGMLTQAKQYFSESHAEVLRRFDGETISW